MSEDRPPESLKEAESLKDLDTRVHAAMVKSQPLQRKGSVGEPTKGAGLAFRIGIELVSAVFAGAVIGLFIDKWLDTAPWFLIVFIFLGAGGGFLNIYRTLSGAGLAIGYKSPPEKGTDAKE